MGLRAQAIACLIVVVSCILIFRAGSAAQEEEASRPPHLIEDTLLERIEDGQSADELEALTRQVLEALKEVGATEPLESARRADRVAKALDDAGLFALALPFDEQALASRKQALGDDHLEVAESLTNLAIRLHRTGHYSEARKLFEQALDIRERRLPPDHPDLAKSLNNMGIAMLTAAHYAEARSYFARSVAIRERILGPDDPDLAKSLRNLSESIAQMEGDLEQAIALAERALEIQYAHFGRIHAAPANTLSFLASLYGQAGRLADALLASEKALEINKKTLGPEHPYTAAAMIALCREQQAVFDWRGARENQKEGCRILERTLGRRNRFFALCLEAAIREALDRKDYDGAIRAALAMEAQSDELMGPRHPDTMLARLLEFQAWFKKGDLLRAEEKGRSLLDDLEGTGKPLTHIRFSALDTISRVYSAADRRREAVAALEAIRALRKTVAFEDEVALYSMRQLSYLLADLGQVRRAVETELDAERRLRERGRWIAFSLSETEALRFGLRDPFRYSISLSLAADLDEESRSDLATALIRSRATVLEETISRLRLARESGNPALARALDRVRTTRARMAALLVQRGRQWERSDYEEQQRAALRKLEEAERALAALSAPFRRRRLTESLTLADIRSALPEDTALVSYLRYQQHPPAPAQPPGAEYRRWEKEPTHATLSYMAMVLPAGSGAPVFVPLGPAEAIDDLVSRWRAEILADEEDRLDAEAALDRYRHAGRALRRSIWDPVAPAIGTASRVFVVPDGSLNWVSFPALPLAGDTYLLDGGPVFHLLSAERDLLLFDELPHFGSGLLALGGPDFDHRDSGAVAASSKRPGAGGLRSLPRGRPDSCRGLEDLHFAPLPGSSVEAQAVASLWQEHHPRAPKGQRLVLVGPAASESAFIANAPGRRLLHLATHGFFVGTRCSNPGQSRGQAPRGEAALYVEPELFDSPFLVSGLALAGVNRSRSAPLEQLENDDGILTAREIAGIDLSGV
ncbi:MAG TPA: tetratricopeptide repeat protein, partial [Acidobacteria bacterium]|nr:tetratricopeptide repeat protein [Acidobacteriota bacterium]